MLNKLSKYINDHRKKHQLNQSLSKISHYLTKIESKEKELTTSLNALKLKRSPITSEQVEQLRAKYRFEVAYLTGNDVFAVDQDVQQVLTQNLEIVMTLRPYQITVERFQALKIRFLSTLENLVQIQRETNAAIESNSLKAQNCLLQIEQLKRQYIAQSDMQNLLDTFSDTFSFFSEDKVIQDQVILTFLQTYRNFTNHVIEWNQDFVRHEIQNQSALFDRIDGKSLDEQQRIAVVTDEDNNLILAGAGSGKTLTISGKFKYLIETNRAQPEEILLISFTRKAAEEMNERIGHRLGINVDVFTFHKLGLSIIAKANQKKPEINDEMFEFLESYMKRTVYSDKKQLQNLIEFFGFYIHIPPDINAFNSLGEYHDQIRHIDFDTIKSKVDKAQYTSVQARELQKGHKTISGETVKSLEEVMIANFLFLHGVNYFYEQPYAHDTSDEQHRQYKPDFYLPDYDIYIEHFGVNKAMKTPWLSEIEEKKYVEGMEWKRSLHKEHSTILIESFTYYNQDGILLEQMEKNLLRHNVQFREMDFQEIFNAIFDQTHNQYLREFVQLISTFIGLFKSCGFSDETFDEFRKRNRKNENNPFLRQRTELFFDLVQPIYRQYQDYLASCNAIDFNDMINLATDIVRAGQIPFSYKYIIIDEYQDISSSRFQLVKAIKDQTNAKIMCVGDDWQSIYRFAGSDIELFTQFEKFFGKHELLRIEKTYRNAQELIDIAGQFVMRNNSQYRKDLKSDQRIPEPVRMLGYQSNIIEALEIAIHEIVAQYGDHAEIMLLGRNNFDVTILDSATKFESKYDRVTEKHKVTYHPYPLLNLYFLTVHRSKGLEADNVIILNAADSLTGFPNKIEDDPILSWVLTGYDEFPFAEERRLFYVALTRTKYRTYLLVPDNRPSAFAKELIEKQHIPYQPIGNIQSITNHPQCPKCKTGHLVTRKSGNREFLGCTNYPTCDYTINDTSVLIRPIFCPECGGYLVKRKGKFGAFYGCTNYPECTHTADKINE